MNLRQILCLSLVGASLVACSSFPLEAQLSSSTQTQDALPTDARLNQSVTLDEAGITLPDTLGKLSKGIKLTCDFECRDQKLQLCVVKRPLRQVMGALADLLPGTWQIGKDGNYKLTMSAEAVKRRRAWWKLYLELRERTLKDASADLLSAMQTPPTANILKNDEVNNKRRPPGVPSEAQERSFFNALPPDLLEKVTKSVNEGVLYSEQGHGASANQESAIVVPLRSLPAAAQSIVSAARAGVPGGPNISDNTWVRFTSDGIEAQANFVSARGQFVATTCTIRPDKGGMERFALRLDHAGLVQTEEFLKERGAMKQFPASLLPLLAYQKSRVWKNAAPTEPLPPSFAPPRRADLLYRLHNRKNMEYVADYYSVKARPATANDLANDPRDADDPLAAATHLEKQLDTLAAQTDSSWKKSGDLYLFRDNRWYRDDLIEIPAAFANPWLSARRANVPPPDDTPPFSSLTAPVPAGAIRVDRLGSASIARGLTLADALDWKARFASSLTRWQTANGLKWLTDETYARALQEKPGSAGSLDVSLYFPFNDEADNTQREYNLMRFYAALRPEQRAALTVGNLKCDTLNAQQQSLALVVAPMLLPALASAPASDIVIHVGPGGVFDGKLTLLYDFPDKP